MSNFTIDNTEEVKPNSFYYFLAILICTFAVFVMPLWSIVYPFFIEKTPFDDSYIFEIIGPNVIAGGYILFLFFGILRYIDWKYSLGRRKEIIFAFGFSLLALTSSIIGLARDKWFWIISTIIYNIIFSVIAPFIVLKICSLFSKSFLESSEKKHRIISFGFLILILILGLSFFFSNLYPEIKARTVVVRKNESLASGKGDYVSFIYNGTVAVENLENVKKSVLTSTGNSFPYPNITNQTAIKSKFGYYLESIKISSSAAEPRVDLELWDTEQKINESWSTHNSIKIYEVNRKEDKESICKYVKSDRKAGLGLDSKEYCAQEKIDQYGDKGRKDLNFFKDEYLIFITANDSRISWEDLEDLALSFK